MAPPGFQSREDAHQPAGDGAFARLALRQHAPVDRLLLALAAEFGPVQSEPALELLDELGRSLFGIAELSPEGSARRLIRVLTGEIGFTRCPPEIDALLLDRVLLGRRGHPALLAAVFREVARRAGVELALVSSRQDWYVGFADADDLVLAAPAPYEHPCHSGLDLHRRCPHELVYTVLRELSYLYAARGHKGQAAHARELLGVLPVATRLPRQLTEEDGG